MLSEMILARAYLRTGRVDLARSAEFDCAWHALFRRIGAIMAGARQSVRGWLR